MVKVYFETDSYSELAMVFDKDEDYGVLASMIEVMAKEAGFLRVTESVTEESLGEVISE